MKIINKSSHSLIAEQVFVADSLLTRLKGLLGRKEFKKGEAIVLKPCNSIHTFFMRFAIDVLFLDNDNKIIKVIPCLKPFRITFIYFKARFAIELPAGTTQSVSIRENDTLSFE